MAVDPTTPPVVQQRRSGAPDAAPPPPTPSAGTSTAVRRSRWRGPGHPAHLLFPLPAAVLLVFFFAIPTFQSLHYSITDWNGYSRDFSYVGVENFTRALTGDSLFTNALANNLQFMLVVVVGQTLLSLGLALLLVRNTRSSTLLRAVFFFPTILSSVSVAFIWRFVYDPNFGAINTALGAVGLEGARSAFLGNDQSAIYWVALTQVWFHAGQVMVIFVAGLQNIPSELLEAAEMDGAGRWQRFQHVTWPMIAPATTIVTVYTTIQSFKAFDLILGMGGNPPRASLDILSTRIYTTFAGSEFGYAAAQSLLFVLVIVAVTFVQRRVLSLTQKS